MQALIRRMLLKHPGNHSGEMPSTSDVAVVRKLCDSDDHNMQLALISLKASRRNLKHEIAQLKHVLLG